MNHDGSMAIACVIRRGLLNRSIDVPLDKSGLINVNDPLELINAWGSCPGCPGDFDNNGSIDVNDLLTLLANR